MIKKICGGVADRTQSLWALLRGWAALRSCPLASLILPHFLRVPLHKGKSLRKALKERGLLEDFLKTHPYSISKKYSNLEKVASEPLTNYLDVSGSAPLPIVLLAQSVLGAPSQPPSPHLLGSMEPCGLWRPSPAPQSAPHQASRPGKGEALKVAAGRV